MSKNDAPGMSKFKTFKEHAAGKYGFKTVFAQTQFYTSRPTDGLVRRLILSDP